jgi:hypothetical protein
MNVLIVYAHPGIIERYWHQPAIALNALFQYVDLYFEGKK